MVRKWIRRLDPHEVSNAENKTPREAVLYDEAELWFFESGADGWPELRDILQEVIYVPGATACLSNIFSC